MVRRGEVDIIFPVGFTIPRTEIIQYNSENVVSNWGQVYLKKGVTANNMLDLNDKKIAVLKDDVYFFRQIRHAVPRSAFNLKVDFHVVDSYPDVLQSLHDGIADAGLVNRFFWAYQFGQV